MGRGSILKAALSCKLQCSAKAGANKAEMFHLTSFSVTSNWRVALDGMVPLTPVLPYAIWGGTVSLRLSPTRMPCTPRSQPAHKGQKAGCLQVHARRRNMQTCPWRTLSILPCPVRVGRGAVVIRTLCAAGQHPPVMRSPPAQVRLYNAVHGSISCELYVRPCSSCTQQPVPCGRSHFTAGLQQSWC